MDKLLESLKSRFTKEEWEAEPPEEPELLPCPGCEQTWTDGGELCDRCAAECDPHDRDLAGGRLS